MPNRMQIGRGATAAYTLILHSAEDGFRVLLAQEDGSRPHDGNFSFECLPHSGFFPLKLLCSQYWNCPVQGSVLLIQALSDLCQALKVQPRSISRLACVRGPGSFTGIRLALSAAAGLARANTMQQAGLDYLWLLALSAVLSFPDSSFVSGGSLQSAHGRENDQPRSFFVLTHARRNLVHAQWFLCEVQRAVFSLRPCSPLQVLRVEEAVAVLAAYPERDVFVLGSGLWRNKESFNGLCGHFRSSPVLLPESFAYVTDQALLLAAFVAHYRGEDIQPLYLRPCDAEENVEAIALSLSIDPEDAKEKLHDLTR